MDMTIALKSLNEMQQTASMRLTIIQHDITVIYVTYFQMYYYLMQEYHWIMGYQLTSKNEVCRLYISKTKLYWPHNEVR